MSKIGTANLARISDDMGEPPVWEFIEDRELTAYELAEVEEIARLNALSNYSDSELEWELRDRGVML